MKYFPLILIALLFSGCEPNRSESYPSTKKFIKQYVPKGAERIEYRDSHGGFHGDGKLWVVYEMDSAEQKEFEGLIKSDPSWKELPVFEEARNFMQGDWADAKDGMYLFHDFQPDWYPPRESHSGPVFQRGSFNFCLFVYNRNEQRIYVYNLDT